MLQQHARFVAFVAGFNHERPHGALGMKRPVDLHRASPRPYRVLPDILYPLPDREVAVTTRALTCMRPKSTSPRRSPGSDRA